MSPLLFLLLPRFDGEFNAEDGISSEAGFQTLDFLDDRFQALRGIHAESWWKRREEEGEEEEGEEEEGEEGERRVGGGDIGRTVALCPISF